MSISQIEITNYKSIRHCILNLNDVSLLIGENGSGKTNILDAVSFFFNSLLSEQSDDGTYNYLNKFCNEFTISITFDFRHLQKISGRNRTRDVDSDYQGYYAWISRRKHHETLILHKIKGKPIRWNQVRKYRQNISNLFPLYYVDARQVNLTDWGQLWDSVGDLMKVHRSKETEISIAVRAIKDNEDYKLDERFQKLSTSLSKANIQIRQFTPKQYASAISALLFRGNVFAFKDKKLAYMSNGTNAFNYTNLLIEILKLISEFKIKDPIVILDEPEISLHHKLIDQLTERIFGCDGAIRFLIASHSPRLLKNIIKTEHSDCEVIHVSVRNNYSCPSSITLFSKDDDARPRVFMTDQHANAYFSKYILSVEGASETEVFSNRYLQELFPVLKNIDIMEGMSDDIVQKIISPEQRHFQTQFFLIKDMDKIITYKSEQRSFDVKSKSFFAGAKSAENYFYSPKRTEQVLRKKRILAMSKNCKFHYWYPFFSCDDDNFSDFLALIKSYFLEQNTYFAETTIEGMLINCNNLDLFWRYFETNMCKHGKIEDITTVYQSFLKKDRLNFMRLLFNGKCDFILKLDEIKKGNPGIDPSLYSLIEENRWSKTAGWMTEWLTYSISVSAGMQTNSTSSFNQFVRKIADPSIRARAQKEFKHNFPELTQLIEIVGVQLETK